MSISLETGIEHAALENRLVELLGEGVTVGGNDTPFFTYLSFSQAQTPASFEGFSTAPLVSITLVENCDGWHRLRIERWNEYLVVLEDTQDADGLRVLRGSMFESVEGAEVEARFLEAAVITVLQRAAQPLTDAIGALRASKTRWPDDVTDTFSQLESLLQL